MSARVPGLATEALQGVHELAASGDKRGRGTRGTVQWLRTRRLQLFREGSLAKRRSVIMGGGKGVGAEHRLLSPGVREQGDRP